MTAFAELTTFRIGGAIEHYAVAATEAEVIAGVADLGIPARGMVLGGGSNLLAADEPFTGSVLRVATTGIDVQRDADRVIVEVAAGESWDELVAFSVDQGWSGIEAMSGIPGSVGATPIQNVGAYGQDVSQVISHVTVLDATTGDVTTLHGSECGFGYRTSALKAHRERIVLSVAFVLRTSGASPVAYAELARRLGVSAGDDVDAARVREAVLDLRAAKGMVIDPGDPDTRSAGSFFTNPIVAAAQADVIDAGCPRYPAPQGVKLSAAWLIEQAGITRGWSLDGRARVSSKHTLALVNASGDATAREVIELARVIRDRVQDAFGVTLQAEPTLVGCSLD